jgi:hypothetical protein
VGSKERVMRAVIALVAALQVLSCAAALARDLPPALRTLIEDFQGRRRVALGYLRTQNGDLGAVEIERLRDRLAVDRGKLPPSTDLPLMIAIARTEGLVASSLQAADGGDVDRARSLLDESAKPLDGWRQENGVRLFSDCIAEIVTAYGRLDPVRSSTPDLADAAAGRRIVDASRAVMVALDRCEQEAGDERRGEPEFRRLFDGMRASLRQLPEAVAARDADLLHRLLIEQRSYEELLQFRFG